MTTTTGGNTFTFTSAPANGDSIVFGYDPATAGSGAVVGTVSTTTGTWLGTNPQWEPDMREWSADDIIDWYASILADKYKAQVLAERRASGGG